MSRLASIKEVKSAVQQLSDEVGTIEGLSDPSGKIEKLLPWLADGLNERWTSFLNSLEILNADPAPTEPRVKGGVQFNNSGESVSRKRENHEAGLPEYLSLFAVGFLGMNRQLDNAARQLYRQSAGEQVRSLRDVVNNTYDFFKPFHSVNVSIHGDPLHWLGERAQDKAAWELQLGRNEDALNTLEDARSMHEQHPQPETLWDETAWLAAEAIFFLREGQAKRSIAPIEKGYSQLVDIFPRYPNGARLLAVTDSMLKVAVLSFRPDVIAKALMYREKAHKFLAEQERLSKSR